MHIFLLFLVGILTSSTILGTWMTGAIGWIILEVANIDLSQRAEDFKAVMLASLRSLIPKGWSAQHEAAWTWLWEHVESLLQAQIGRISQRERLLANFFASLDDESRISVTWALYAKFFELVPAGRELTTYLPCNALFLDVSGVQECLKRVAAALEIIWPTLARAQGFCSCFHTFGFPAHRRSLL